MSTPLHTSLDLPQLIGVSQLKSWLLPILAAMVHSWQPMPKSSEFLFSSSVPQISRGVFFSSLYHSFYRWIDGFPVPFHLCSGVYAALLLSHAIMGSLTTKFIARIQYFYVFLNIAYVHCPIRIINNSITFRDPPGYT